MRQLSERPRCHADGFGLPSKGRLTTLSVFQYPQISKRQADSYHSSQSSGLSNRPVQGGGNMSEENQETGKTERQQVTGSEPRQALNINRRSFLTKVGVSTAGSTLLASSAMPVLAQDEAQPVAPPAGQADLLLRYEGKPDIYVSDEVFDAGQSFLGALTGEPNPLEACSDKCDCNKVCGCDSDSGCCESKCGCDQVSSNADALIYPADPDVYWNTLNQLDPADLNSVSRFSRALTEAAQGAQGE